MAAAGIAVALGIAGAFAFMAMTADSRTSVDSVKGSQTSGGLGLGNVGDPGSTGFLPSSPSVTLPVQGPAQSSASGSQAAASTSPGSSTAAPVPTSAAVPTSGAASTSGLPLPTTSGSVQTSSIPSPSVSQSSSAQSSTPPPTLPLPTLPLPTSLLPFP